MIFEDPSHERRRWAVRAAAACALFAVASLALYAVGLAPVRPRTPAPVTFGRALPTPTDFWREAPAAPSRAEPPSPEYARLLDERDARAAEVAASVHDPAQPLAEGARLLFTVDDPASDAALRAHAHDVSAVSPDWFRVPTRGCEVREQTDRVSRELVGRPDVKVMPRVANLDGDRWTSAETAAMLADESARRCVAHAVAARAVALGAHGVNVDFESLAPEDAAGLVAFVAELRAELHPAGRAVTVDVAAGDRAYDLARLSVVADAVVLMAYDQHHPSSAHGPIASRAWVADAVDIARRAVPLERLVVALGSYCYDWAATPGSEGESLGFSSAMARAALVGATPRFVPGAEGSRFDYRDARGVGHTVWCNDAVSVADTLALLATKGVTRTALWRAGTEDPSLWGVLRARDLAARTRALSIARAPLGAAVVGEGDVLVGRLARRDGARRVTLDTQGFVTAARYVRVPTPRVIERLGAPSRKLLALTFDDGPDPRWTAELLDVLAEAHAPGAFFVVGEQAAAHPGLVRRAAREGHRVANHSYHHPRMDSLDEGAFARELDATTRLLESLAGREVTLYRAPFTAVVDPSEPEGLRTLRRVYERGYGYVAASVDPHDWEPGDAETLAARIVAGVEAGGRVVVLHDGGGDRHATVEAVRRVIPRLRAKGYTLVSLDEYAGLARAALAPELSPVDRIAAFGAGAAAYVRSSGGGLLAVLFTLCTSLAALRIVLLAALALRAPKRREDPSYAPLVTVLIPAYDEAAVIAGSVRSLLKGEYANIEVLVVDDGSRDDTAAIVEGIAMREPRVRCVRKTNGGKASAANLGIQRARGEIIVAVDADTRVAPDAIGRMVAHFADPCVTAVCGNVEVGNVRSVLTAFQAVEYVTSQNFDRRAFAALNCVGVVPGALGAWRRDAVIAVGGYSGDTLVEDADLTIAVLRAGGVITYEPRAIGRTEAPESLGALWRQRVRWTYGTYQCLAKHRGALFRGSLGWVALPNLLLFQVVFPLVSPLGDLAMLYAVATGRWSAFLSGYLGFLAMDVLASVLAFRLDRKPFRWLGLLLVQRFTYRQFLYFVSLVSMVSAVLGSRQGWRKLDRLGSVASLPPRAISLQPTVAISITPRRAT